MQKLEGKREESVYLVAYGNI